MTSSKMPFSQKKWYLIESLKYEKQNSYWKKCEQKIWHINKKEITFCQKKFSFSSVFRHVKRATSRALC